MHELSITQSVVTTVSERLPDATVRRIRLEIGRLSGVAADSVRFCFDMVAEGTPLDGAVLEITESSGRARCRSCGEEFEVNDLLALCDCGSADLELLAGQELLIKEVEVAA
ncbi:MAG: hydrogenase maturation nickel metallochaperone HypA [Pseudonocardiaceae bacterium]|nr:hydrogenase maturation nickel metallochaperone HypA [Pseudonocardiaceae bacterium]